MEDEELSLSEEEARVLIDLGRRLEGVVPEEDMADDDMEPEMEDEEPMEEEYAMADDDDEGMEEGMHTATADDDEELEEALNEANIHILSEDEETNLVQEVFKRVTKRIIADRLK